MMNRRLLFTAEARDTLERLGRNPAQAGVYRQVLKTLGLMETNLRHPSLQTHAFESIAGPNDERIFEAYSQNNTPGAYRVFFHYGPDEGAGKKRIPVLTIVAITPHP